MPINNNFETIITVENLSSKTATFVTLTDELPSSFTFVTSPNACAVSEAVVNCTVGELLAGEVIHIRYTIRTNTIEDNIQNNVSVTAAEADLNNSNNTASISIDVVNPEPVNLSLSGSITPTIVNISDEMTINLLITNIDTTPAYLTNISVFLPPQLEFISSSNCIKTENIVHCSINIVEPGIPQSLILIVRAVEPSNLVTLEATISHADVDPDMIDNETSLSFTINEPPNESANLVLSISPSASQFITSEPLLMTYVVSNQGPNHATNVSITHELPSEIDFISSTDCTLINNAINCEISDLGVNNIYTVIAS